MKYLSICSGIEAASVAFEPLGWRPLAFSEIEAFPRAVLQHHYPDTPLHGDFTVLKDEPWIVDADMLCGGTPCQAFSVAGNRQSLADDRGNLTLQFVLLADAIDHLRSTAGREPAWILWENVPGVLSTHDNAFGAFLAGLAGNDGPIEPGPKPATGKSSAFWRWSKDKHVPKWPSAGVVDGPTRCVAWRVLNAEYFGLAQRRKRVFVLALGGAGRWAVADALLPIIESSRWHPAPGRGKGEGTARGAAQGFAASSIGQYREGNQLGTLRANGGDIGGGSENLIAHTLRGEGFDASEDGTGRGVPLVMSHGQANAEVVSDGSPSLTCNHEAPIAFVQEQSVAFAIQAGALRENPNSGPDGIGIQSDLAYTMEARSEVQAVVFDPAQVTSVANRSNPQPGDPCHTLHRAEPPMLIRMREGKEGGGKGPLVSEDQSLTLATGNDQILATPINTQLGLRGAETSNTTREGIGIGEPGDPAFTLQAAHHHAVQAGMQVRRLTPVECARLQGFPDDYLDITYRGKPAADGNKYKALGNSWAVPVVRWIGERIKAIRP